MTSGRGRKFVVLSPVGATFDVFGTYRDENEAKRAANRLNRIGFQAFPAPVRSNQELSALATDRLVVA